MIASKVAITGCGKGGGAWFDVDQALVSYDHPYEAPFEHALNIDFVNKALGPGARIAIELDAAAARRLVQTIQDVLDQAEAGGFIR
jgi:hypothetical protein